MIFRFLLVVCFVLIGTACSDGDLTPEEQIEKLITRIEEGVEARELGEIKEAVSDDYKDARQQDKKALVNLARFYFLRHQAIHLYTKIGSIDLIDEDNAKVVVYVGMAGSPVAEGESFAALSADLHRFEADLRLEDGDWRLMAAQWRRAKKSDFTD